MTSITRFLPLLARSKASNAVSLLQPWYPHPHLHPIPHIPLPEKRPQHRLLKFDPLLEERVQDVRESACDNWICEEDLCADGPVEEAGVGRVAEEAGSMVEIVGLVKR